MNHDEMMRLFRVHRDAEATPGYVAHGDRRGDGYHPATISKWVREGGPPPTRSVAEVERVIDGRWANRLNELLV